MRPHTNLISNNFTREINKTKQKRMMVDAMRELERQRRVT